MLKRKIEIAASFTGTINKGSYENEKPFYSLKEIIELDENETTWVNDKEFSDRQNQLYQICRDQFKRQEQISCQEKIEKEYQNIRFYDVSKGIKYPSVTSIIGWDDDFKIGHDEMIQYAARGTIIHKQVEIFLATGEIKKPKEIHEIYPELVILKKGNLNLAVEDVDICGFFEKYPIKVINLEEIVINNEHKYAGRYDIMCIIESSNKKQWDKVEGCLFDVPTILDCKTGTLNKTKMMKQQTAYARCIDDVKQIGLIHLNNKVSQGFSKPILENNLDKYWSLFLNDRENFKKRYGI